MGNIVGEDHLKYVKDQIKLRQEILGKSFRSNEDVVWANNKGSWIRLISSVNISDEDILYYDKEVKENRIVSNSGSEFRNNYLDLQGYGGNQLSKELILQGGTLNNNTAKFGVANNTSNLPSSDFNYGYGGTDFGLNPMPGIEGFNSKTYNNGSLREATIQIKANNRKQFEYIESTYLRLGYTMLLEWGNSTFPLQTTNDDGTTTTQYATVGDVAALSLKDDFLSGIGKGASHFYTKIDELREKSQGNYDGFLGAVKNFSWRFNKDGSYTINLILITIGSVIESLKLDTSLESINFPNPNPSGSDDANTPEEDRPTALEVAIDMLAQTQLEQLGNTTVIQTRFSSNEFTEVTDLKDTFTASPTKKQLSEKEAKALDLEPTALNAGASVISCNAYFGNDAKSGKYYLRLGSLLEFINKKLLLYDKDKNPSHIQIDTSIDTYCYSNAWSFPGDPNKMMISFNQKLGQQELKIFAGDEGVQIDKFHDTITDGSSQTINVGRVMNLYFEKDYIKSIIKQNTDSEKGLSVYNFITTLLNTANDLLGNVNKLRVRIVNKPFYETTFEAVGEAQYVPPSGTTVDPITGAYVNTSDTTFNSSTPTTQPTESVLVNESQFQEATFTTTKVTRQVLEIYDEVPFYKTPSTSVLNIYGFNPTGDLPEGNMVLDYSLETNIDKNLGSQIAIGAQAGGRGVGEDSTIFSKWNIGLVDRVIPSKLDIDKADRELVNDRVDWKKLQNTYKGYLIKLTGAGLGDVSSSKNVSQISFGLPANTTISDTINGYIIPNLYLTTTVKEEPTFIKFNQVQKEFFNKVLSWDAERKGIPTPFVGFLPVKLSLTLDGLSGIRIFDKLTIDSRFLPKNYGETLEFIITELDHLFQNNKWVTRIGTLSIPKLFADRPEVTTEEILDVAIEDKREEEPRKVEDSELTPSYFFIKGDVYRGIGIRGKETKRITAEGIPEILGLLNSSDIVQSRFSGFLNELLTSYPYGYQFTINSVQRPLDSVTGVGLASAHIWGLAIDMSVREAQPVGQETASTLPLYGLSPQTKANADKWVELGIPDIAYKHNLVWGGDFRGSWAYDTVHFAAAPNWSGTKGGSQAIARNLKKNFANVESAITRSIAGNSSAKSNLKQISVKNYVRLTVNSNGKSTYTTNTERIEYATFKEGSTKNYLGYTK